MMKFQKNQDNATRIADAIQLCNQLSNGDVMTHTKEIGMHTGEDG